MPLGGTTHWEPLVRPLAPERRLAGDLRSPLRTAAPTLQPTFRGATNRRPVCEIIKQDSVTSFPRKNVTPADSKPGRESNGLCRERNRCRQSGGWIPARAALGRNDGELATEGTNSRCELASASSCRNAC